jgi:riboflavin transporter FmnP
MKLTPKTISKVAVFGALVVVFDYSLKFSGFKIPYPWLPFLKFDFTGIPIILSTLILGFEGGTITSTIAFLAILVRSGDVVGASMKGLAEFSTVFGMFVSLKWLKDKRLMIYACFTFGCISRAVVMIIANLVILPTVYGLPMSITIGYTAGIAGFNIIQGLISIFGGELLYEALKNRVPSLISKENFNNP